MPPTNIYFMEEKKLTAANGRPIADNQNSQTAGQRGPVMLQDPWLIEKLAHFDREVIPERRMHAKGSELSVHLPSLTTLRSTPVQLFSAKSESKLSVSSVSLP